MNFYSSAQFLKAFNQAYFPNETLTLRDFQMDHQCWRFPTLANGKPLTGWDYIDYFEPAKDINTQVIEKRQYIARASHGVVTVEDWFKNKLNLCYKAAPFIDWKLFPTWSSFQTHFESRQPKILANTARRKRIIVKEIGELSFMWHDPRPEIFELYIQWKSEQFSGVKESFAEQQNRRLFQQLIDSGLVIVSSLSAGDKVVAVTLSAIFDHRLSLWMTTYNKAAHKYSPGTLILHQLLNESYHRGHQEFSFLLGEESFKFLYATHVHLIGEVAGLMPITRTAIKKSCMSYQTVLMFLKRFKRILGRINMTINNALKHIKTYFTKATKKLDENPLKMIDEMRSR